MSGQLQPIRFYSARCCSATRTQSSFFNLDCSEVSCAWIEFKQEAARPKYPCGQQRVAINLFNALLAQCKRADLQSIIQRASFFSAALFCPPPHSMHSSLQHIKFVMARYKASTDIH
jgi:hypothetical protein